MNTVTQFLKALHSDPKAKGLAMGMQKPENEKETAGFYVRLAKQLGYEISEQEMIEGITAMEQAQLAQTAKADSQVEKVSLSEDALDQVAGGDAECKGSVNKDEWCWWTDACSVIITKYTPDDTVYFCQSGVEDTDIDWPSAPNLDDLNPANDDQYSFDWPYSMDD